MGGFTQRQRTTHTGQGRPLHRQGYIESQGDAGVDVRCHNLLGGEPNHTTSSIDRTNTEKVGNSEVKNQVRVSIIQDNSYKDGR